VINTGTSIGTMVGLAYLGIHYTIYTAAGYFLAFIVSYILNGIFTFQCERLSHRAFLVFVGINGSLLILVEVLQISLIEFFAMPVLLGVAFGMVIYTLLGFFLNRRFVYQTS
jgi:putative flippase GtrA